MPVRTSSSEDARCLFARNETTGNTADRLGRYAGYNRGQPFSVKIGSGQVIKGFVDSAAF